MSHENDTWTTNSEVDYLTNECGRCMVKPQFSRIEHLKRYRDGMDQRVNWGQMDKAAVREAVDTLINIEGGTP
jgi:hypothetical protein